MIPILILFACAFLAFSLSAISGGGAGLLLMPVLGMVLPLSQVPAALSIGTASTSASRIIVFYGNIRWDIVKWFVPAALPAVFIGAWLLRLLNPIYLEIAMGLFLVSNLPAIFKKSDASPGATRSSRSLLMLIGFLAGFLSGLTGAVGLLFNRFYLQYGLTKEEIVATRAANEMILHIIKLVLYASFGLVTSKVIGLGLAIAVAGLAASLFMKWGLQKISELFYRRVGYAAMVVSGVFMLTQSGNRLMFQNNAYVSFLPVPDGVESKVQWQKVSFAFEFAYDEGFEYEREISLAELPEDKQRFVLAHKENSDLIFLEEVFGIGTHGYEAYYFKEKKLVDKIEF
jgi:uncharacterized membrane protein YfcA